MRKLSLILIFVLLPAVSIFAQSNNSAETSTITEKEFNEEMFGIRATVVKKGKKRENEIPLHNTLKLNEGDRLWIQVDREVNGFPMSGTGKNWFLAVILFNPIKNITAGNVLVRDLRQFNNDYYFDVNTKETVVPIIFLMTKGGYETELVKAVGDDKGKEAIKNLSSGLNKYSTVLEKIQKYTETAKKLLEEPPANYKTQSAFDLRLLQISKIFGIEIPPTCHNDEIKKQLSANPTLTDWRLKKSECIASNVDIAKIKINWLAVPQAVVSEVKTKYPAIGKYSTEIGLAVDLVSKFIIWYQNRKPKILFVPARFKKEGSDKYRIFTQNSVVVNNVEYAVMIMPKPVENLRIDTSKTTMKAALLEKEFLSLGTNSFKLWNNDLVFNDSVNFFLEIEDKKLPLEKSESGSSFFIDLKPEDLSTVPANGKVKIKIIGEYDSDKKIVSNEMELITSTRPD